MDAKKKAYMDKYNREYYQKNKQRRKEYDAKQKPSYYEQNKEEIRKKQNQYQRDNADAMVAYRLARRKGVKVVEVVERHVVFERDNGTCYLCNEEVDPNNFHLDHVVPITGGGEHSYANVRLTHPECNQRRKDNPVQVLRHHEQERRYQ